MAEEKQKDDKKKDDKKKDKTPPETRTVEGGEPRDDHGG